MGKYYPPPPGLDRAGSSSLPPRPPSQMDTYRPPSGPSGGGSRGRDGRGGDGGNDGERKRNRGGRKRNKNNNRDTNNHNNQNNQNNHPSLPSRPPLSPMRSNVGFSAGGGFSGAPGNGPAPPQGDFTFRAEKPAGVYEAQQRGGDSYVPSGSSFSRNNRDRGGAAPPPPTGPRARRDRGPRDRRNDRRENFRPNNGNFRPRFWAADRPILYETQGPHNGVTQNFVHDNEGTTYLDLNDLSDSDEAEMDISGDEKETGEGATTGDAGGEQGEDGTEPPKKRARVAKPDADAAPKWSNPDPYTALPAEPPQKKKDVVHMIRKARMKAETAAAASSADVEEFISCDVDSDEDEGGEEEQEQNDWANNSHGRDAPNGGNGQNGRNDRDGRDGYANSANAPPPGAPKGPRAQQSSSANNSANNTQQSASAAPSKSGRKGAAEPAAELNPSRKRTHDDRLKPLQLPDHAKLKKVTKMPTSGNIVKDWQVDASVDPIPWLGDHSDTEDMNIKLHEEIMDFYNMVKPRTFEQRLRQDLIDELNASVRKRYSNGRVFCFGSFMSGLYLPTGDMDMCMCSTQFLNRQMPMFDKKSHLYKFSNFLVTNRLAKSDGLERIAHAKVPLVKYIDTKTGLKVDISFENTNGVTAIKTFEHWKEQYPAMPILVVLVKQFLTMRGLNEPVNGGIGGFSIICLVVSMLQLLPAAQAGFLNSGEHLGELLLHFFELYGKDFNYKYMAIQMNPPCYLEKDHIRQIYYKNFDRLSIIDPNNSENDISGGSKNTFSILQSFADAYDVLKARMDDLSAMPAGERHSQSILGTILQGNYSTYQKQRQYLRDLYVRVYNEEPTD